MKTFVVTVQVEYTCKEPKMATDRVMSIPFGDHDMGFRIIGVREDKIQKGKDETLLPKYRRLHGLPKIEK